MNDSLGTINQAMTRLTPGPLARLRQVQDRWQPDAPLVFFSETASTQDEAGSKDWPHGTALAALSQTGGRGREGRSWTHQPGNLAATWIVKLGQTQSPALLPLFTGLCAAQALDGWGLKAQVKWPNDVVLGEKKLAGILVDAQTAGDYWRVRIGLGLNVFPVIDSNDSGYFQPGSLAENLMHPPHFLEVLAAVLEVFWGDFEGFFTGFWLGAYQRRMALLDQAVVVSEGPDRETRGRVAGVGDDGRLLLVTENSGTISLASGRLFPA